MEHCCSNLVRHIPIPGVDLLLSGNFSLSLARTGKRNNEWEGRFQHIKIFLGCDRLLEQPQVAVFYEQNHFPASIIKLPWECLIAVSLACKDSWVLQVRRAHNSFSAPIRWQRNTLAGCTMRFSGCQTAPNISSSFSDYLVLNDGWPWPTHRIPFAE